MAGEQLTGATLGLSFAATLPRRSLPRFTASELLAAVNDTLSQAGTAAELVPKLTVFQEEDLTGRFWHRPKSPPRIGLKLSGVVLLIQGYDRGGFQATQLEELDDRDWTGGRQKVARARARLEITEAQAANCLDFDHNHDRAAAIIVVAHAAAKLAQAIGIVWHASGRAVQVEALDQLVAELVDGRAPALLWLGCSPAPETAGRLMTRGFYPLLGGEIEVASTALAQEVAFEVALALAAEILAFGESPAENETIEFDARTAFHVGYRQGGDEGAIPAIVLTHVPRQSDVERAAGAA